MPAQLGKQQQRTKPSTKVNRVSKTAIALLDRFRDEAVIMHTGRPLEWSYPLFAGHSAPTAIGRNSFRAIAALLSTASGNQGFGTSCVPG